VPALVLVTIDVAFISLRPSCQPFTFLEHPADVVRW